MDRLRHGALVEEVACKVRDTIAGAVWACGRDLDDGSLPIYMKRLFATETPCRVILWLEDDPHPMPVDRSTLGEQLKRALRWLNPRVSVRSRTDSLPGVTATLLPVNPG